VSSIGVDNAAINAKLSNVLGVHEAVISENSQRFRAIAKEGTCRWIRTRPWYKEWYEHEADQPHLLWLSGHPAAGKSVLCRYIADMIEERYGIGVCQYHTISFEDKTQRSASYLLRSFAYQIACRSAVVSTGLLAMSEQFGISYAKLSAAAVWEKIFKGLIFNLARIKTLFWVVDGLDEAESETISQLFQFLKSLDQDLRIKILLVNRPIHDISLRFQ